MTSPRPACRLVALVGIGAASTSSMAAAPPVGASVEQDARRQVVQRLDRMPLLFVPEQVSPDGASGYAVRGSEASVWLSASGLSCRLHPATGADNQADAGSWLVALDLVGATPRQPVGEDPLPTKVSYFKGPKDQWRTGLPSYSSVRYREPWPGVDVVVSGTAGELESTFVVKPGTDPGLIRLAYRGAEAVRLDADGSLVVDTPLGSITEQAPVAYQEIDGQRVALSAGFELEPGAEPGRQSYRFWVGPYDPARELVVDPVTLIYCGYIGGSGNESGTGIAVDASGNAYVTGSTGSSEATFPVTVGPDLTFNGSDDVFVAKVNAAGTTLDYCGYIGGSGDEVAWDIAIDATGNAYINGSTDSTEATFPVTVGPDLTYNGGDTDVFVARINAAGTSLDYCGYIGGSGDEHGYGIAVDTAGNVYLTGNTDSTEATFPVMVGPDLTFNGSGYFYGDAFVAKVVADGTALDYCGYIGGSDSDTGRSIAVDAAGNAYVSGGTSSSESTFPVAVGPDLTFNGGPQWVTDAFVAKVNVAGTDLVYCGYVGGSGDEAGAGMALDAAGNAYLTGRTTSTEATFPVTVGPDLTFNGDTESGDAFVARVNAAGTTFDYCGYIGGSSREEAYSIAVDTAGNAYVSGDTWSTEATFPVTVGPDLTHNGGSLDAFVAKTNAAGTSLDYCGYIGGAGWETGYDIAVDAAGSAYVTGVTASGEATFPITDGPDLTYNGGGYDAFVAKVSSPDLIFADGFESGDTGEWSSVVPGGEPSPPGETCGPGDSLGPTDTLPWSGSLDPNSQDFTLGGPGCDTQIGDDVVVCFTSSNDCMIDAACSVGSGSHTFNLFEGECTTALTPCVANIGLMDFEVTAGQTYCIVCSASDPGPVTVFIQVARGGNSCHFITPA